MRRRVRVDGIRTAGFAGRKRRTTWKCWNCGKCADLDWRETRTSASLCATREAGPLAWLEPGESGIGAWAKRAGSPRIAGSSPPTLADASGLLCFLLQIPCSLMPLLGLCGHTNASADQQASRDGSQLELRQIKHCVNEDAGTAEYPTQSISPRSQLGSWRSSSNAARRDFWLAQANPSELGNGTLGDVRPAGR
jgi:hypothetical protein